MEPLPDADANTAPDHMQIIQLRGFLTYYQDGLKFINQVSAACKLICEILASTSKTEVVGAMKFFVMAHRFDMECAEVRSIYQDWRFENDP